MLGEAIVMEVGAKSHSNGVGEALGAVKVP